MSMQETSRISRVRNHRAMPAIVGMCGAALILVVAAGTRSFPFSSHESHGVADRQAVQEAAVADTTARGAPPAGSGADGPWYLQGGKGPTWYLVASRAQAEYVGEVLSYRNLGFLLEGKELPSGEQILVVASPLAERQIRFASAEERGTQIVNGQPPLSVLDLRSDDWQRLP